MKTVATLVQSALIALVAVILAGVLSPVMAQQEKLPAFAPKPPKATGGECDADPKWMRKWHMRVLDHKRDETMHQGIRSKKYSLKRCITCHAVKAKTGGYLSVKEEGHFCRECHVYTAVRVDCFDCHASRPDDPMNKKGGGHAVLKGKPNPHQAPKTGNGHAGNSSMIAAMQNYFGGKKQ